MADEPQKSDQLEEPFSIQLPVRYYGMEDVVGIFADLAMVQHGGGVFTLSFFQNQLPPTEDINIVRGLSEVPTKCVARIVITPALVEQLADAMMSNMGKFRKVMELHKRETEGE